MEDFRSRFSGVLDRLSHAYILACPDHELLQQAAAFLAAAYVCTGEGPRPCMKCTPCRKAVEKIHPDVIWVEPAQGKQGITVDQIRTLRQETVICPNESYRKVFVLDQAQTMNAAGQNALLKILEEGPPYLAFLLLTEDAMQLLPTIRSRCESLSLRSRRVEQPEEDVVQTAEKLCRLMLEGDEMTLAEYTVELEREKWNSEHLQALFLSMEQQLLSAAAGDAHRILPLLELVRELRRSLTFHVGAGHLFGRLAAVSAESRSERK